MRTAIIIIAALFAIAATPIAVESQDDALVGWETLGIPGWEGMVKRDPFTDN